MRFTDSKGTQWDLTLNVGLIEDIKEHTGVDLDSVLDKPEEISSFLFSHPKKLVEVFYVICEEQIKEQQLDAKQFGKRFDRDTIDKAVDAFLEAILSFYPRASAGRALRRKLPDLLRKMDEKIEQTVMDRIIESEKNGIKVS
jgi:hypothetical protein